MKKKLEIVFVAGARPNFMKVAPLLREVSNYPRFQSFLVHTGQHYDPTMFDLQFRDLGLPSPDENLEVGSGAHGWQTAMVLERMERLLIRRKPALVVVVGDVNSTIAGALAARKLEIPVAHVEAGLRSWDRSMPEEINRVATDAISDHLFTHCREANENLLREGVPKKRIFFVGNVMIDTLIHMLPKAREIPRISKKAYGLITLHRPSNVDHPKTLRCIFGALEKIGEELPLFFPVHPRTVGQLRALGVLRKRGNIEFVEPLSYLPFLSAMSGAQVVLTDSGGVQEETTALGVPCLTLRQNSERAVTVREGTNQIVGGSPDKILRGFRRALKMGRSPKRPKYWDGKAAQRILRHLNRVI